WSIRGQDSERLSPGSSPVARPKKPSPERGATSLAVAGPTLLHPSLTPLSKKWNGEALQVGGRGLGEVLRHYATHDVDGRATRVPAADAPRPASRPSRRPRPSE